jgi:hypothetical protein
MIDGFMFMRRMIGSYPFSTLARQGSVFYDGDDRLAKSSRRVDWSIQDLCRSGYSSYERPMLAAGDDSECGRLLEQDRKRFAPGFALRPRS